MSDNELDHKREEDERLDTAEDQNEEVRMTTLPAHAQSVGQTRLLYIAPDFPILAQQFIQQEFH